MQTKKKAREKIKAGISGVMERIGMKKEEVNKYPIHIQELYVCVQATYKHYESKKIIDTMYAHSYTTEKHLRKLEYKRSGGMSGGEYLRFMFHKKGEKKQGIYLYVDVDGFYTNEGYITKFENGGKPLNEQLKSYELTKWFKDNSHAGEEAVKYFKTMVLDLKTAQQLLNQYADGLEVTAKRIQRIAPALGDFQERVNRILNLYENHYKSLFKCKGRKIKFKEENGMLYIKIDKKTVRTDLRDLYDNSTGEPIDNVSGGFTRQVEGFKFGRYVGDQVDSTDRKLLANCLLQGYDLRRNIQEEPSQRMGEHYGGLKIRERNL